ncbi:MAG: hydrolase [Bacteroidales bacterium]|nr:hydrolase [Bacteroidales bacterium]MCB9013896.1 hydrolase [Bacteroidales bacterium]
MRILAENCTGLFIDIQERLFPVMEERDLLEQNLLKLSAGLNILKIPLLVTEQYSKGLGPTIPSLKPFVEKSEFTEKMSFSCCDDPGFMKKLNSQNKKQVIIAGIETHVCILQTTVDLLQLGYTPVVIEDCVSSRKMSDKIIAINRMRQEGAVISSLESVLFELLRLSGTDTFRAISKLIK